MYIVTGHISHPYTCMYVCVNPRTTFTGYQEVDLFSEIRGVNFDNVFGDTQQQQQPSSSAFANSSPQNPAGAPPMMGGILQPQAVGPLASESTLKPQPQRLTKDVDSSLARAAENLSMSSSNSSNFFPSSATSPSPWPSENATRAQVVGNVITGSSPWTTTDNSGCQPGQLQHPLSPKRTHEHTSKNPLDDIVIPESLFAGTVV